MPRQVYICTDHSKWSTCRVEKMGCEGCYYFKQLYKLAADEDRPKINEDYWKKKVKEYRKEK